MPRAGAEALREGAETDREGMRISRDGDESPRDGRVKLLTGAAEGVTLLAGAGAGATRGAERCCAGAQRSARGAGRLLSPRTKLLLGAAAGASCRGAGCERSGLTSGRADGAGRAEGTSRDAEGTGWERSGRASGCAEGAGWERSGRASGRAEGAGRERSPWTSGRLRSGRPSGAARQVLCGAAWGAGVLSPPRRPARASLPESDSAWPLLRGMGLRRPPSRPAVRALLSPVLSAPAGTGLSRPSRRSLQRERSRVVATDSPLPASPSAAGRPFLRPAKRSPESRLTPPASRVGATLVVTTPSRCRLSRQERATDSSRVKVRRSRSRRSKPPPQRRSRGTPTMMVVLITVVGRRGPRKWAGAYK